MINYYSRYQLSNANGVQKTLPFIKLSEKSTDKQIAWEEGISRMDIISDTYYGKPIYGIFIMMANPQYGGMEFDIPDNVIIRVPFPLEETLKEYFEKLKNISKTN